MFTDLTIRILSKSLLFHISNDQFDTNIHIKIILYRLSMCHKLMNNIFKDQKRMATLYEALLSGLSTVEH